MDDFEQRGDLPALICGATGKEISFAGNFAKLWTTLTWIWLMWMEESILVYRNEVSKPQVWVRLAQLGLEGRWQGGCGGAQLSWGGIKIFLGKKKTLNFFNPFQHGPVELNCTKRYLKTTFSMGRSSLGAWELQSLLSQFLLFSLHQKLQGWVSFVWY